MQVIHCVHANAALYMYMLQIYAISQSIMRLSFTLPHIQHI